ncbi:MAG: hypothetical protein HOO91_15320 [Bacteroidales bacterium]|nr:hypothetical protein [Bacteroidales bacterium]
MKKVKILLTFLILACVIISCEKDEEKAIVKKIIASNELSALSASSYILLLDSAANDFQTFNWTKVDFGFTASITYKVQIDVKGNDFASAVDILTVNNLLTKTITIGDFNKFLLDKELEPETAVILEFRVKAIVNDNVAPIYSNIVEATITPYATSFPPIYMCGSAVGGWDWTKGVEMRSTAPKVYQTIAYFENAGAFRFFAQANWGPTSYNYPYFATGTVSALFENANDGDSNFKFIGTTGYFSITVNLKTKTVEMTAVDEPKMFMTGGAVGGWDWTTNYVQMTWKSNGIFEATTDFINGEAFRFFAQKDWGPTSYNYPYFAGGTVSNLFENANDGDKNFRFTGTTGNFKITLNMLDKIITMTAQ